MRECCSGCRNHRVLDSVGYLASLLFQFKLFRGRLALFEWQPYLSRTLLRPKEKAKDTHSKLFFHFPSLSLLPVSTAFGPRISFASTGSIELFPRKRPLSLSETDFSVKSRSSVVQCRQINQIPLNFTRIIELCTKSIASFRTSSFNLTCFSASGSLSMCLQLVGGWQRGGRLLQR